MKEKIATEILSILQKHRRVRNHENQYPIAPFIPLVVDLIKDDKPFKMTLSAFHCKSINPDSVLGTTPDGAEEEAIKTLESVCAQINKIYPPGCELLIVHEGHFYSDIKIVPTDAVIDHYEDLIHKMTHNPSIKYCNIMKEFFSPNYDEARRMIFEKYIDSIETIEGLVRDNPEVLKRYVAYKAFVVSEFSPVLMKGLSKTEIKAESKRLAYLWMQRYLVFKKVTADLFQDYFKLSVLSYPSKSKSFGINLVVNTASCGLPWFHVLLKKADGSMQLIKKHEAEKQGYELVYVHNKPWYYKKSNQCQLKSS